MLFHHSAQVGRYLAASCSLLALLVVGLGHRGEQHDAERDPPPRLVTVLLRLEVPQDPCRHVAADAVADQGDGAVRRNALLHDPDLVLRLALHGVQIQSAGCVKQERGRCWTGKVVFFTRAVALGVMR